MNSVSGKRERRLFLEILPSVSNRKGWPWDTEVDMALYNEIEDWPKISIVTPSYNQGEYLEETIRSVLLQNYPNLEYIVIDGGSTDNSIEIIKKYEPWITYWKSEPDQGQSDALIKGFSKATGTLITWLNSDDWYAQNSLSFIGKEFVANEHMQVLCGACCLIDSSYNVLKKLEPKVITYQNLIKYWIDYSIPPQPSVFFSKSIYDQCLGIDINLNYAMDYDLWLQLIDKTKFYSFPTNLSFYRIHNTSKSGSGFEHFVKEWHTVYLQHIQYINPFIKLGVKISFLSYNLKKRLKGIQNKIFSNI